MGTFDGFVHSIGFAPSDQLVGNFVDVTTREGFKNSSRYQLL